MCSSAGVGKINMDGQYIQAVDTRAEIIQPWSSKNAFKLRLRHEESSVTSTKALAHWRKCSYSGNLADANKILKF